MKCPKYPEHFQIFLDDFRNDEKYGKGWVLMRLPMLREMFLVSVCADCDEWKDKCADSIIEQNSCTRGNCE